MEGELEYLHRKSRCKMVIAGDDITNDIITLRARFRFAMIGGNLTAQSMGSPRGIGSGIQIPEKRRTVVASSPSFSRPAVRALRRACLQVN